MRKVLFAIIPTFTVLLSALGVPARADEDDSKSLAQRLAAADLPLEERLAARYARRPTEPGNSTAIGDAPVTSTIDGTEHPELLMPHELFNTLVQLTVVPRQPEARALYRQKFAKTAEQAGIALNTRFYEDLERLTREYRALLKRVQANEKVLSKDVCASAHRAFTELQRLYGRDFQKFLYVAVAPGTTIVSTDTVEDHLQLERGCP